MRKKYRVHLSTGAFVIFKASDVTVKYNGSGYTEWSAENVDRFINFLPQHIVAVEEVK